MRLVVPFEYNNNLYYCLCCEESNIRLPVQIVIVLDRSCSMSTKLNKKESILDYTKNAIKILIDMLSDQDHFSLVVYDNTSVCLCPLLPMNVENKSHVLNLLNNIETTGCTNIHNGLKCGLNILSEAYEQTSEEYRRKSNMNLLLFTDGCPTNSLMSESYKNLIKEYCSDITIHTFGFGTDLRVNLMSDIAKFGNGRYSYINDEKVINQVFKNTTAALLTSAIKNVVVYYRGGVIPIGTMCVGQSRYFMLDKNYTDVFVEYTDLQTGLAEQLQLNQISTQHVELNPYVIMKIEFLNILEQLIFLDNLTTKITLLNTFFQKYKDLTDEKSRNLADNVTEPLAVALSSLTDWNKWGRHYIPSLYCVYNSEIPNINEQTNTSQAFNSVLDDIESMLSGISI